MHLWQINADTNDCLNLTQAILRDIPGRYGHQLEYVGHYIAHDISLVDWMCRQNKNKDKESLFLLMQ